jgi:hypothetical protein
LASWRSDPDDHDAPLGCIVIFVVVRGALVGLVARGGPIPLGERKLELWALVTTTLFLFATSDLLNDPGLEHRRPYLYGLQYRRLAVKERWGMWERQGGPCFSRRRAECASTGQFAAPDTSVAAAAGLQSFPFTFNRFWTDKFA